METHRRTPRLPSEELRRAIVLGVRYIINSPSIKIVLARSMVTGVIGGAIIALMPLVARDLLHGDAQTYGIMLSAFGLGAVIDGLNIAEVRKCMSEEAAIRACALSMGGAVAACRSEPRAGVDGGRAGLGWRRVDDRVGAIQYWSATVGAPAGWRADLSRPTRRRVRAGLPSVAGAGGHPTDVAGANTALLVSAAAMSVSPLLGLWLRMPRIGARGEEAEMLEDPKARLALTGRSGPLVVEIEYRVAQKNARAFHNVMQDVQLFRQRNGAYG